MITLDDVCVAITDCEHKTAPKADHGYPSIRTTDIKNGRIDFDGANRVSEDTYTKWTKRRRPIAGDLILAREAPVGEVGLIPEGVLPVLGQRTVLLSPNRAKVEPRYLHYLLISPDVQHSIEVRSAGSTVHHLNMKDIRALALPELPPLPEQRDIAATLGALDDKIELNRKTAAVLEEMARALYRSWFVDFDPVRARAEGRAPAHMDPGTAALFPDSFGEDGLPVGWSEGALADLIDFNPKERLTKGSIAPYFDMKALPTAGMVADAPILRAFSSGTKFRSMDTLLARITPCLENGKTAMVEGLPDGVVAWGSTEFIVMRAKPGVPAALPYCVARDASFRDAAIATMTGSSGRQRADADAISALPAPAPDQGVLRAFGHMVDPLIKRVHARGQENRTLAALRDALLPRLMSGELRVGAAREMLEEVA